MSKKTTWAIVGGTSAFVLAPVAVAIGANSDQTPMSGSGVVIDSHETRGSDASGSDASGSDTSGSDTTTATDPSTVPVLPNGTGTSTSPVSAVSPVSPVTPVSPATPATPASPASPE